MTVYWRAKFEKRIGSPVGIRSYNPLVNSARVKFKKVKARDSGMGRSQVCQEHRTGPLVYLFPEVVGKEEWAGVCRVHRLGGGHEGSRRTEVETDTHSKR